MPGEINRRLKPEEEEMLRKREELAAIRATLAERELELVDLRSQLAAFEGTYLRQVGRLYAELDEWKARIFELQVQSNPSAAAKEQAEKAREQARQTNEDAHGKASEAHDFTPSPELKRLFREVAKRVHPDFAMNSGDLKRRTRFMTEANRAYQAGDAEALQRIFDECQDGADTVAGEGIGAELIRIIRQISQARNRLSAIEQELATLRQSEIAQLKQQAETEQEQGRDLLAELGIAVQGQIQRAKKEYEDLAQEEVTRP
jgi:hypothetical protein